MSPTMPGPGRSLDPVNLPAHATWEESSNKLISVKPVRNLDFNIRCALVGFDLSPGGIYLVERETAIAPITAAAMSPTIPGPGRPVGSGSMLAHAAPEKIRVNAIRAEPANNFEFSMIDILFISWPDKVPTKYYRWLCRKSPY